MVKRYGIWHQRQATASSEGKTRLGQVIIYSQSCPFSKVLKTKSNH